MSDEPITRADLLAAVAHSAFMDMIWQTEMMIALVRAGSLPREAAKVPAGAVLQRARAIAHHWPQGMDELDPRMAELLDLLAGV